MIEVPAMQEGDGYAKPTHTPSPTQSVVDFEDGPLVCNRDQTGDTPCGGLPMKITKDFWVDAQGYPMFKHTATVNGKEYHAEIKMHRHETNYPLERITWQLRSMITEAVAADLYKGVK